MAARFAHVYFAQEELQKRSRKQKPQFSRTHRRVARLERLGTANAECALFFAFWAKGNHDAGSGLFGTRPGIGSIVPAPSRLRAGSCRHRRDGAPTASKRESPKGRATRPTEISYRSRLSPILNSETNLGASAASPYRFAPCRYTHALPLPVNEVVVGEDHIDS